MAINADANNILLRSEKGIGLTYAEVDANFTELEKLIADVAGLDTSVTNINQTITNLQNDALLAANNLSDVASASTARTNLNVYSKTEVDNLIAANGGGGTVAAATTTDAGIIELATQPEVDAGTDATRAVVPATLAQRLADLLASELPISSTTARGIIELATQTEVNTGSDAVRAVSPATLQQRLADLLANELPDASETVKGIIELATSAEVATGTDATRAVTPVTLQEKIDGVVGVVVGSVINSYSNPNPATFVEATGQPTPKSTNEELVTLLGDKAKHYTSFSTRSVTDTFDAVGSVTFKTSAGPYVMADVDYIGIVGEVNTLNYSTSGGATWAAANNGNAFIRGQCERFNELNGIVVFPGSSNPSPSTNPDAGRIARSGDGGINYTFVDTGLSTIFDIFTFNGFFYAVDVNGAMERSTDALTWTPVVVNEPIGTTTEITQIDGFDELNLILVCRRTAGSGLLATYRVQNDELYPTNMGENLFDNVKGYDFSGLNGHLRGASISGGETIFGSQELDAKTLDNRVLSIQPKGTLTITGPVKWVSGNLWVIGTSEGLRYSVDDFNSIEPGLMSTVMTSIKSIDIKGSEIILGGSHTSGTRSIEIIDLTESVTDFMVPNFTTDTRRADFTPYIKAKS